MSQFIATTIRSINYCETLEDLELLGKRLAKEKDDHDPNELVVIRQAWIERRKFLV